MFNNKFAYVSKIKCFRFSCRRVCAYFVVNFEMMMQFLWIDKIIVVVVVVQQSWIIIIDA